MSQQQPQQQQQHRVGMRVQYYESNDNRCQRISREDGGSEHWQRRSSQPLDQRSPPPIENDNQGTHQPESDGNGCYYYYNGCHVGSYFDPNDAASYLPQDEHSNHHPHYYKRNNITQSNYFQQQQHSPLLSTSECSYEWDPLNLNRFLSIRNQMTCALFSTEDSSCRRQHQRRRNIAKKKNDAQTNDNTTSLLNHDGEGQKGSKNIIHYDNNIDVDDCGGIWCSHPNFFAPSSAATRTYAGPNNDEAKGQSGRVHSVSSLTGTATTATATTTTTTATASHKFNYGQDNKDQYDHPAESSMIWNELLPMPKDYFSYAIRYLLMDTPLPLVGRCSCSRRQPSTSSNNIIKTIHPQRSRPHGSSVVGDGESSIYLLPRYYLLRWMNWARCTIIHSSVECWFAAWRTHDDHQRRNSKMKMTKPGLVGAEFPDNERQETRQNNEETLLRNKEQQQNEQRKRIYSLPIETLKALAALSLLSEQYELFTNTETDFVDWIKKLEDCWNDWNRMVGEYHTRKDQHSRWEQQAKQHDSSNLQEDHQIQEGESNGIGGEKLRQNGVIYKQGSQHSALTNRQYQRESRHHDSTPSPQEPAPPPLSLIQIPMPYPHSTFPVVHSPGPVDSRMLSTRRNPLVMHHHVALSMRGVLSSYNTTCVTTDVDTGANIDGDVSVLTPADDASETKLISFIDNSLWVSQDDQAIATESTQHLAIVPVPTSFYELLRSVHGVYTNDGDVSYAPPPSIVDDLHHGNRTSVSRGMTQKVGRNENEKNTSNYNDAHSSSLLSNNSLLFHDQWKICDGGANNAQCEKSKSNHRIDNNRDLHQGYHPLYFANDPSITSSNSEPSQSHVLCRPIEFRRHVLPVSLHEVGDACAEDDKNIIISYTSEATTSPYSPAMQEAIKSKKINAAVANGSGDGDGKFTPDAIIMERNNTKERNDLNIAGYAVEVFPVEFLYTIVDGDTNPPTSSVSKTNTSGRNKHGGKNVTFKLDSDRHGIKSHQGIALASRHSSAFAVLRDLQQAATPRRAQTCVRLWMKSACQSATGKGDGYDLLDTTSLSAAPSVRLPPSPRSGGNGVNVINLSTHYAGQQSQLTVEQWLGLEPLSVNRTNELKDLFYGGKNEKPVKVELLVEIRQSISSKWVRHPLELTNRLQIGDYVDAQDSTRKWYEAIVRDIKPDSVRVHYFGWGSKWDAELPRRSGSGSKLSPPAPLWTRTARWREQIKEGDEVEIRESTSLVQRPKWHRATVLLVGGENDAPRELAGGAELELVDVNSRKVPLILLNLKRQVLVEVPQEMHNLPTITPLPTMTDGFPTAQPPFRRWVNLYGEEICNFNTHKIINKKLLNLPATLKYTLESERAPVEVMRSFNNSHGSGFVRESLRGIPPAIGTVGLHNLGNTCYMNSILQCIKHIKPITQYFLKGDYVNEINKHNPLGSGGRVATAYASFLSDIYSGEFSILAPRLLKHTLSCYAPQFRNNHQHDSQEFCQYLLDGLHEDLNRVKSKPYVEQLEALGLDDSEAAMISWKKHLLRHDSIFVDYTQGLHRSHLTCPRCGRESIKFDVYSSISLPLVPAKNRSSIPLSDCLDQFAAGEQLDENNAWYCPSCKRHVCALKLITLWTTPDILVLHLKRFTFEKSPTDGRLLRSKIEDKVNFPIDRLDLTSYVLGPTDPAAPPVYKLFGVSEHTGSTANSGHYTATVLNSEDGNWYRYNDSHVGTTSGDAAVTGGAYLLFYRRAHGALRWGGMETQMRSNQNIQAEE